jgi:hypothetical protein
MKKKIIMLTFLMACIFMACKKDGFIESPDASIRLSADTIFFDTVFTTAGSVTQSFTIQNDNDQKLRLTSVSLAGGNSSPFKINVDGTPGPTVSNLEMDANDSLHVFVSVLINPDGANLPFIVRDSVRIEYNGNTIWLQLEAWGQNANFFRNAKLTGNVIWTKAKPYVILGGLQVDTTATLTIQKGTKIYMHADAPLVIDGTLRVDGEASDTDRVYFSGDRLDYPYNSFPGSWPGIYFRGRSRDNQLNYAVIRNAYQGVVAEDPSINAGPKLILNQCIIENVFDAGILGFHTSINASNCLVSNCGKNVVLVKGGIYNFNHCTVASYSSEFLTHKEPVFLMTNFVKEGNSYLTEDLSGILTNCIFWGDGGAVDDEVVVAKQGTGAFSVSFNSCLWRVKTPPANISSSNIIANIDPQFDSIDVQKRIYNFRLKPISPAINKGVASSLTVDLDGKPRAVGIPDLGSYEKE